MDNKEQNNPTEEPEDGLVVQPEITTDDNPLVHLGRRDSPYRLRGLPV